MKKNILFLHIPKTAGQTIRTAFNDMLKKNNNIDFHTGASEGLVDQFSLKYFNKKNLNKDINIFTGHFVFSEACKNFDLFSIVRNPIDLFISSLYFFYLEKYKRTNLNSQNIKLIKKQINFDLELSDNDLDIIPKLIENNFVNSNIITKTIAGVPYEKYYLVYEDYKLEEEDYLKAKENLKYFKHIGNVENVESFLKILLSYVPLSSIDYRSVNIFKKDKNLIQNIKNSIGDMIKDYNYYDTKLLEIIKKKFS